MQKNLLIILTLLNFQIFSANFINQKNLVDLTKSATSFFQSIPTMIHELGHAITAKILTNSPINMHFGIEGADLANPIAKFGGISLHSFNLTSSAATFRYESNSRYKNLLIILMGPICEIIALICLQKLVNTIFENKESPLYKENSKKDFFCYKFYNFMITKILITQILHGFTPFYAKQSKLCQSDGYKLWELLGIDKEFLNKIPNLDNKLIFVILALAGLKVIYR